MLVHRFIYIEIITEFVGIANFCINIISGMNTNQWYLKALTQLMSTDRVSLKSKEWYGVSLFWV